MAVAPSPDEVYQRAVAEGRRRLDMPVIEQVTTAFIAGVTIVFGIVALGVVESLIAPELGEGVGAVAGAVAFAIGLVFLIVGRTELFTENFFDPVAAAMEPDSERSPSRLGLLWSTTLVFNLVGGSVLLAVMTVDGALPHGPSDVLIRIAEKIGTRAWAATLARAVLAGALITLLSYLLAASNSVASRILVAFMVGSFLALGPFDHVIVSALHLLFGIWLGGAVGYGALGINVGLAALGNLVGGLFLITFTHAAQVWSERRH
ncbi:formate/nitrite transporter family protein [Salsipaludibacter albus]|uniref:formate/nitrite transporter family protein n=1 Tax=Salsipaludibacter albus TaxID=2849650 RepID=UPI001EE3F156|nr:formate/nitrite transporter family protein [Salsipaludibacter albus]MBY5161365.1 formate/nitrite transporter family protein [Salsipaludibacter albus]